MTHTLPKTLFGSILLLKTLFIVWLIVQNPIQLGPDEAQYWTWSRKLDFGYYSKPPAIAWQIWLGCATFGQTELGVRIGSVLISILIAIGVYQLAKACQLDTQTSSWAGVIMAVTPLGFLSALFAITDTGMVLFWTLALIVCVKDDKPNDLLLGVIIAIGALFKWPIYFFWLVRLVWGYWHRPLFRWTSQRETTAQIPKHKGAKTQSFLYVFAPLRFLIWIFADRSLVFGIAISLLGLFPSLIWNANHEWVTFRHVFATINVENPPTEEHPGIGSGNPLDFIGAQAALLSPIFFILLLLSLKGLTNSAESFKARFCGWSCFVILGFYILLSFVKKMQGNWCDFVYPAGIVWLTYYTVNRFRSYRVWMLSGALLSLALVLLAFSIPFIQAHALFVKHPIPYRINPFKHNLGWLELAPALEKAGYDPSKDFLLSDKYQTSSLLSFYGPLQKRAYFLNIQGTRLNQFSFWPGLAEEQKGGTGYFVVAEKIDQEKIETYRKQLMVYFDEVDPKGPYPLFLSYGTVAKEAWIFVCSGYNGKEPPNPHRY